MAYKLKTAVGKAIYGARTCAVEPVIGIVKEVLGFRQFSLQGLQATAGEWCLVCLAFNLERLHTLLQGDARRLGGRGCRDSGNGPDYSVYTVAARLGRFLTGAPLARSLRQAARRAEMAWRETLTFTTPPHGL